MATNNTQTNSRRNPTPPRQTTPPVKNTIPPSHPPLQYDDLQRFREYAHSIDFFDDDDLSTDDVFANAAPLPELEIPSIIQQAEQFTRQQAQNYTLARGTGLGKTEGRPQKRARVDTPQPGREEGRGDVVKEDLDGEGVWPQRRVRFDVPKADNEREGGESVREGLVGEAGNAQCPSAGATQRTESVGDEGDSYDDCAWSVDSAVGNGEERNEKRDVIASCDRKTSLVQEPKQ
jgi:hypothetical protein